MKKNCYSINLIGCFFCFLLLSFFSFQSNAYPAASSYYDTVQKIYIGYYQRPADPMGMMYWTQRLDASYGNLNAIIDAFANSPEAQSLYGTINSSSISNVINNIYLALLNRDADAGGRDYYAAGFNAGRFTSATIMLNILDGATVGADLQSVNNKLTAANLFTRTIENFRVTYGGDGDNIAARNFLALNATSVKVPTQADTTAYIKANIANPDDPILSVANAAPVANAGMAQNVATGAAVMLNGSGSSDANGDLLTYNWTFTSKPSGSGALLSSVAAVKPTFTADVAGAYVFSLVVNDGKVNSTISTVTVTAVTVTADSLNSITVVPTDRTISLGQTKQYFATGIFTTAGSKDISTVVNWVSSNTAIATINDSGLALSTGQGTTTISATMSGKTSTTTLTVGPIALLTIAIDNGPFFTIFDGQTLQLTATATYTDGTKQDITELASWSATFFLDVSNKQGTKGLVKTTGRTGTDFVDVVYGGMRETALMTIK